MATRAETYERIREPMATRGIEVGHLRSTERVIPLTGDNVPFDEFDVGFVFPSRLMEGGVVDTATSIPWVNDRDAVLTSRNKGGVIARLAAAGLPTPETHLVSNPADERAVAEAAEDIGYPVIVKPNSTTRGTGIAKAPDPDSLAGIVDYLDLVHDYRATGDKSFLIQEFLPAARDYRVMVLDGEVVGAVERRLPEPARNKDRWKHNVHRGATAEGVDLPREHRRLAERTAEVLGIDFLGVDLLETPDSIVVSETNARPTIDEATKYEEGFYDRLADVILRTAESS